MAESPDILSALSAQIMGNSPTTNLTSAQAPTATANTNPAPINPNVAGIQAQMASNPKQVDPQAMLGQLTGASGNDINKEAVNPAMKIILDRMAQEASLSQTDRAKLFSYKNLYGIEAPTDKKGNYLRDENGKLVLPNPTKWQKFKAMLGEGMRGFAQQGAYRTPWERAMSEAEKENNYALDPLARATMGVSNVTWRQAEKENWEERNKISEMRALSYARLNSWKQMHGDEQIQINKSESLSRVFKNLEAGNLLAEKKFLTVDQEAKLVAETQRVTQIVQNPGLNLKGDQLAAYLETSGALGTDYIKMLGAISATKHEGGNLNQTSVILGQNPGLPGLTNPTQTPPLQQPQPPQSPQSASPSPNFPWMPKINPDQQAPIPQSPLANNPALNRVQYPNFNMAAQQGGGATPPVGGAPNSPEANAARAAANLQSILHRAPSPQAQLSSQIPRTPNATGGDPLLGPDKQVENKGWAYLQGNPNVAKMHPTTSREYVQVYNPETQSLTTKPLTVTKYGDATTAVPLGTNYDKLLMKNEGDRIKALNAGIQAATTMKQAASNLVSAARNGSLDDFKGLLTGNFVSKAARRLFPEGLDQKSQEIANDILSPTSTLIHVKQLVGGRPAEKIVEHMRNSIEANDINSGTYALRVALVIKLIQEHYNGVLGKAYEGTPENPDMSPQIMDRMNRVVDAYMNTVRNKSGDLPNLPTMHEIYKGATGQEKIPKGLLK